MFEQSLLPKARTHRVRNMVLAAGGQVFVLGIMVVVPLIYFQVLPSPELTAMLVAPPPPPPPPPPAPPPALKAPRVIPQFDPSHLYAPINIPKTVAAIHDLAAAPPISGVVGGVPGGAIGGSLGGVLGGILNSMPSAVPPPVIKPAPPPKPAASAPIRVGGDVEAARLVNGPPPPYPPLAREARIQGTVRMEAVIGKDGHIEDLRAVSGNALLVGSAMQAVKQWVYRPTYLNGQPVEVKTEIDVNFRLSG